MEGLEKQLEYYAKLRFEETKKYLYTELEILEIAKDYPLANKPISQLPGD